MEIPILVVTFISLSLIIKGESNESNILLATLNASSFSLPTSGKSIVNSSPANLDNVSFPRIQVSNHLVTSFKTKSPVSLT